jgi:hypothetical protein
LNCEIFDPVQYKINTRLNWNTIAPNYHTDWASRGIGPFKSTTELVKAAEISTDDIVLDIGCGTGVVSREVSITNIRNRRKRMAISCISCILYCTTTY